MKIKLFSNIVFFIFFFFCNTVVYNQNYLIQGYLNYVNWLNLWNKKQVRIWKYLDKLQVTFFASAYDFIVLYIILLLFNTYLKAANNLSLSKNHSKWRENYTVFFILHWSIYSLFKYIYIIYNFKLVDKHTWNFFYKKWAHKKCNTYIKYKVGTLLSM